MKYLITLVMPAFFTLSSYVIASDFDKNNLIGTWGDSNDGVQTFWGFNKYTADDELISWGEIPGAGIKYEITSKYKIETRKENHFSCITVTGTSDPEIMPVGYNWCDQIVEVTDSEFTYMSDEGKTHTLYKQ